MRANCITCVLGIASMFVSCSKVDVPVQTEEDVPVTEDKHEIAVPQIMTKAAMDVASCQFDFFKPDGNGGFTRTESLVATYSSEESKWSWAGASGVSEGVTKMVAILRPDVFNYWGWNSIWLKDMYEGDDDYKKSIYDNGIMVGVTDFNSESTNSITVHQALAKLQITLDEDADFPIQTDFYMVKDGMLKIDCFSSDIPIETDQQSRKWHVYTSKYDKAEVYDVKNSISLPIVPQAFDVTAPLFEYTKCNNRFCNSAYPDNDAAPIRYSYKLKETVDVRKNRVLALTSEDLVVTETPYVLKTAAKNIEGKTELPYSEYFTTVAVNDVIRITMTVPATRWVQPYFKLDWYELPDYNWNAGFNGTAGDTKAFDIVVNSLIYEKLTRKTDDVYAEKLIIGGDLTVVSVEIWTPKAS